MFFVLANYLKNKILTKFTIFYALPVIFITGTLPAGLQQPTPVPELSGPSTGSASYEIYLPFISRLVNTDLSVSSLEITQAVQDAANSVPLVAGRPAVLRIYPHTNTTDPVQGVSISISATRDGQVLAGSPVIAGPASVAVNPTRSDINSSFNVRLPSGWLSGVVSLQVTIDPGNLIYEKDETNNTYSTTLTFNIVPALNVTIVPIDYYDSYHDSMYDNYYPAPTQAESQYIYSSLMQMYPVSSVNITWRSNYPGNNQWFDGQLEFIQGWDTLLNRILSLMITDHAPPTQVYWGLIPVEYSGKTWVGNATMQGYSELGTRGGIGLASSSTYHVNGGVLITHEIGHMLGLLHAPCPSGAVNYIDRNYPYDDGSIGQYGLDVTDLTQFHLYPNYYKDIMSYCQPAWVSDYTYKKLYDGQRAQLAANRSIVEKDGLFIRAVINADDKLTLEPVYSLSGFPSEPKDLSEFRVEFLNAGGEVVDRSFLPVLQPSLVDDPSRFINVLVKRPASTFNSIRIVRNGEIRAERSFEQNSSNPSALPDVLQLDRGAILRWGSTSIPALVRYTTDQGISWTTLAMDWLGGELFFDPATMPPGPIEFEIILADSNASSLHITWENQHP